MDYIFLYSIIISLLPFHVNMNERGGELMKPAGFSNGSLLAPYPLMMYLRKNETQLIGLEFRLLVKALRPSVVHI
jgi:hypothetical protein